MGALIDGRHGWSQDTELLALLVEEFSVAQIMYLKAHSQPGATMPRVIRLPRPWDEPAAPASVEQMREFFGPRG
jgi:hypothetical protein